MVGKWGEEFLDEFYTESYGQIKAGVHGWGEEAQEQLISKVELCRKGGRSFVVSAYK